MPKDHNQDYHSTNQIHNKDRDQSQAFKSNTSSLSHYKSINNQKIINQDCHFTNWAHNEGQYRSQAFKSITLRQD